MPQTRSFTYQVLQFDSSEILIQETTARYGGVATRGGAQVRRHSLEGHIVCGVQRHAAIGAPWSTHARGRGERLYHMRCWCQHPNRCQHPKILGDESAKTDRISSSCTIEPRRGGVEPVHCDAHNRTTPNQCFYYKAL